MPAINKREKGKRSNLNSKMMAVCKENESATVRQFNVTQNNGTLWQKQETELVDEHSTKRAFYGGERVGNC
jgi:hypothetical protein